MKLTPKLIQEKTHWANRSYLSHKKDVEGFENDPNNKHRRLTRECRACFYLRGGFAGSAFTAYQCLNCGAVGSHPDTAVPRYCGKCSDEHKACVRCGGGLE